MSSWTIHLPPPDKTGVSHADRFKVVKDGVRPFAVALGPFWLLAKGLWWGALGVVAAGAMLAGVAWLAAIPRPMAGLLFGMFQLLVGLEASTIQRWTLGRNGWREVGAVVAHGRREAELRAAHLIEALPPAGFGPPPTPAARRPSRPAADDLPQVLGLFPEARPR